jgi:Domain of unknown function (DUF4276)
MRTILPIVEGEGDKQAVPALIHKILQAKGLTDVRVAKPHAFKAFPENKNPTAFLNHLKQATTYAEQDNAHILWTFDCDDDCPIECVRHFNNIIETEKPFIPQNIQLKFAFFVREFESLFLSEANAAREILSISTKRDFPENAEKIRNTKGELSKLLPNGKAYKESRDQLAITKKLNLDILRQNSRCFRHFEKTLLSLLMISP